MRLTLTDRRPCKMVAGDMRRLPAQPGTRLIGYFVVCPNCDFTTDHFNGDHKVSIAESATGVTFSGPISCMHCKARITLIDNLATVELGPDVLSIRRRR